jgi:hypothetical protein
MQVITNNKTKKNNTRIGQYTSLVSLLVLGIGMYISIAYKDLYYYSLIALIVGFILSQIGIYFGNRWGRKPTIDERITAALKGLSKENSLYHFITPVSHLLVGPNGIWIIEPYYQKGTVTYEKGKFKQKSANFLNAYLRIFAQEGLGRPELEIRADVSAVWKLLQANKIELATPDMINVVLAFYDPKIVIHQNDSPYPMVQIDQLKTAIRLNKNNIAPAEALQRFKEVLPLESN